MATRYLLPCPCGKQTPVLVAQAGGTVRCECGNEITVPTLRGLRELGQEASEQPAVRQKAWTPAQGYLYSLGIVFALAGICFGAWQTWLYLQVKPYTVDQSAAVTMHMNADVDEMNILQTFEEWKHSLEHGLADDQTPEWIQAQKMAAGYLRTAVIAFIVAGVGLLAVTAAFLIRPTPRRAT